VLVDRFATQPRLAVTPSWSWCCSAREEGEAWEMARFLRKFFLVQKGASLLKDVECSVPRRHSAFAPRLFSESCLVVLFDIFHSGICG
jgi:hypothetical protein